MGNIKFGEKRGVGGWLAHLLAVVLWVACIAPAAGQSSVGVAPGATDQVPLQLLGSPPQHSLTGHLAVMRDPSGRMTVDDVVRAGPEAMQPLPGPVSLGFTRDTVWLRFVVDRPDASQPEHWWLTLSLPLIQQTQLYEVVGDARRLDASGRPGAASEVTLRVTDRLPVFEIAMHTPGVRTYYLRLQSDASMALSGALWQPRAMSEAHKQETFFWGGLFGAYGLVIVFYLAFWAWTRERLHIVYVFYVLCNFLAALFTGGWPRQLWPGLSPDAQLTLLGVWLTLPLFVGSWFSMLMLGMDKRWPKVSRATLVALATAAAVIVVAVLLGHYQPVIPAVQGLSIVMIGGFFAIGIYLAARGERTAFLFLGAFSFFYVGVAWRYLRNIGLLEPNFWNDNSYQIGAFVHMLVMSVGIFSRYGNLRRQHEEAQARVAAETALRAQQRDFMAMVSHEFRTPLSIITATTHNLLNDAQLPAGSRERVQKVIRANDRMANLMENYLANERLLDQAKPQLATCDLLELCQAACEDLEDAEGPAPVLRGPAGVMVDCDEDLLRIALTNLLTNARRHSPPGAAVEIEVSIDGLQARVLVRDQGKGIPAEEAEHIFKRFFRGRNARDSHGAGLGLYLVQDIAHRHGGGITARNLVPAGCEFTLSLPRLASLAQ